LSSGEIKELQNSGATDQIEIVGTCPCFRSADGENTCVNGNTIEEIEAIGVHPDLIMLSNDLIDKENENELPLCYGCVQINHSDGLVQCVSRKKPIQIRNRLLEGRDLRQALEVFPRDRYSTDQDICATCLYIVLNASFEEEDGQFSEYT